jgi:hypothetical protein
MAIGSRSKIMGDNDIINPTGKHSHKIMLVLLLFNSQQSMSQVVNSQEKSEPWQYPHKTFENENFETALEKQPIRTLHPLNIAF